MKYKIIIASILLANALTVDAQNLLDIYKSGETKLVADENYGKNNNWNEVFKTYNDTIYGKHMGNRKSIKIMPDGSVVVSHAYRNFYSLFSPDGNFDKKLHIKSSDGSVFKKAQGISGIINGNMFYTGANNMGKMLCFDFNGNYKKTLTLDYHVKQTLPMPNGKIAVVGWVIWKTKFRDFVSVVDFKTNEEKVIWEHFTPRSAGPRPPSINAFNYSYYFKERGAISMNTMPFSKDLSIKARPKLAFVNNHLNIIDPTNNEIRVYDMDGNYISKTKINLESRYLSVAEQKEIQQKAIDKLSKLNPERFARLSYVDNEESIKAHEHFMNSMKKDLENIKTPILKPFFATQLQDSDDNLLLFEYPKEKGENVFNVYVFKNGGEFICQSSFACEEYDLQINPSKMVFHKGYLYALVLKKDTNDVPLRLVRFKLTNQ